MIQRPAAGGASPSPTISFVCFAFARHCNQTCGTSNTRVQAPYPTTLCNVLPRVVEAPTPTKRISSRPTLLMIQRPAAGGASPSPTISFICFAFARHCNQTCGTSNTRVQAPYPTTLCNALPRVVEAPTPTKRISSRPTFLMIQRPAAGGASPSPTPLSTFHFQLSISPSPSCSSCIV